MTHSQTFNQAHSHLLQSPLLIIALLAFALVVRLYQIGSISNDYHSVRQYSTAMQARPDFLATQPDTPAWRLVIAKLNQQPMLEPPVIQQAAILAYRIVGSEQLALPRAISAIFWIIGGYFVYLLGKKLFSPGAALIAMVFFLFAPFGLLASRSFQPNPMMVAMTVISLYTIVCYFENPTTRRLLLAILASAIAIFIMLFAAFTILLVYYALAIQALGWRRATLNRQTLIFGFLSVLPAAIYYFYGLFIGEFLASQTDSRFLPSLWFSAAYWINWANHIVGVIGLIPIILSIQALVMNRRSKQAVFLHGLWLSYILFGLVFNYHIMSHSYYSLPLIPIAALSIGSVAHQFFILLPLARRKLIPIVALMLSTAIMIWGLASYLPTTITSRQQFQSVESAQKIGKTLEHTSETIFLTADDGMLLEYYGEISGKSWPNLAALNLEKISGKFHLTAEQRLQQMITNGHYRYFVITSMTELQNQTELAAYLNERYPVLARTGDYLIYQLDASLEKNTAKSATST